MKRTGGVLILASLLMSACGGLDLPTAMRVSEKGQERWWQVTRFPRNDAAKPVYEQMIKLGLIRCDKKGFDCEPTQPSHDGIEIAYNSPDDHGTLRVVASRTIVLKALRIAEEDSKKDSLGDAHARVDVLLREEVQPFYFQHKDLFDALRPIRMNCEKVCEGVAYFGWTEKGGWALLGLEPK